MNDPSVEALRRLVEITEGGRKAVAETIHANDQTLYQILERKPLQSGRARTVGRDLRERLDRHYPGWMNSQHATEGRPDALPGVAQPLSYIAREASPVVPWESLMSAYLPPRFCVEVPDDSMAPWARAGELLEFHQGVTPRPLDRVLVVDARGTPYVREYRVPKPGAWVAHALNEAFPSLDSERDGLRLLAVAMFRITPLRTGP